ncbi:MAG: hypothetical protein JXB88_21805 [Spirochaetales bacterium]|nr:hypothetical protein [Spirochaetales bacterium]
MNSVQIERVPDMGGPFDIIGDVHRCFDELVELPEKHGYQEKRKTISLRGKLHPCLCLIDYRRYRQ